MLQDAQIIIFVAVFTVTYFVYGKWNGKLKPGCRHPPSLPSLPLVGSLPFLRNFNNIPDFFMEKSRQLGPVFTFRVGNKTILTLNSKEVIEEALVTNSRSFSFRPEIYIERISNPNSKGIIFRDTSPEWKRVHRTSLTILKEFGFVAKNLIEEKISREVEAVVEYIRNKKGESFDPTEIMTMVSSNIIMTILYGRRRDYDLGISKFLFEIDRFGHLMDMVYDIAPILKYIPPYRGRLSQMKDCVKMMLHYTEIEISKSLQNPENDCFVLRYIEKEGENYDQEQLNYVLRDIFAAGTDTTGVTFRWLLVALANDADIQKKLQQEIDSVIPRSRFPTLQDQNKLPYAEATILELYRWRTLVPLSVSRRTSSDTVLSGHFIPAGTMVLPNLYSAHNNPEVWGDPEVFRPERFLDRNRNIIKRDLVIPFSLGRRSCLGEILARAEIFLVVTCLAQRFIILPPEGQEKVSDKPTIPISITTSPEPYAVRLIERK